MVETHSLAACRNLGAAVGVLTTGVGVVVGVFVIRVTVNA